MYVWGEIPYVRRSAQPGPICLLIDREHTASKDPSLTSSEGMQTGRIIGPQRVNYYYLIGSRTLGLRRREVWRINDSLPMSNLWQL